VNFRSQGRLQFQVTPLHGKTGGELVNSLSSASTL